MSDDDDWGDDPMLEDDDDGWGDDTAGDNMMATTDGEDDNNDGWDDDGDGGDGYGAVGLDASDDEWEDEEKLPSKATLGAPVLERQHSYAVLSNELLFARQQQLIRVTAELLFVTQEEASCLLRHYGWKNSKLQNEWFSSQDEVRRKVGLSRPLDAAQLPAPESKVQCQSAFCDEVAVEEATALNCGHWFCNDCWHSFLESQLKSGRRAIFATCMGMACEKDHNHKFGCACNEMIPDSMFARFIKDQKLLDKYKDWLLDSFVEGQRKIKWCPRPKCNKAVEYSQGGYRSITCGCGHTFCFSCMEEAHMPCPCDLVKKWNAKSRTDDATEIWLAARTKQCPNCQVRIEKNKACNHMKCSKCGHDFCWLCKGPWSKHGSSTGGYYVCNKYNESAAKGAFSEEESKMMDKQKVLQKYNFYYKRFVDSQEGIKHTKKLSERLEQQMTSIDVNRYLFIGDAIAKLIFARRVLQWTYAMAYYLKSGGKKNLFEHQQQMLMEHTEKLQELMESDSRGLEGLLQSRKKIINLTSSTDKFAHEMVKHVESGDFEDRLLSEADIATSMWACTTCSTVMKPDKMFCTRCSACRRHGEAECRACKRDNN
eukprot:TRINITY_DN66483_c5_g1_i1.p1 TRINITY_DN66483_c5_g1~~TRINITY_DN66483_c5_g1_i1.p1  ORF type:complete len:663 (-),score=307.20 TRINITY_DN66483_c5_g1_i1:1279-3069(-)